MVYVYDNNSKDSTDVIARQAGAVVRYEHQQGKGNVIRRMFREIDARCYIMVDGDDTYPAECGPAMAKAVLEEQADMVIGDRLSSTYFAENKRPFHNVGNSMVRSAINSLFRSDIKDVMTGCRAFSYAFVKTFPVLSRGFEIETEMTIHAVDKNMRIENVIIEYRDRPEGSESKLYKNYHPLGFFGRISTILILASALLFLPIAIKFLQTGFVPNFPTLIVSGFIAVTAIISYFAGLILETLTEKERQEFEFRLQVIENLEKSIKNIDFK